MKPINDERRIEAIKANIQTLADILTAAGERAGEAATRSANERDQNGAIGTLSGIEEDLESALALYRAALALHRGGVRWNVEGAQVNDKFIQPAQAIIITPKRMIGPCPRCGGSMQTYTCSWFTTESICTTCQQEEKSAPNFEAARRAEEDAIRRGDFNFPGIGLAPEDVEALAAARRERK